MTAREPWFPAHRAKPLSSRRWLLLRIRTENRIALRLKRWAAILTRDTHRLTEDAVKTYRAANSHSRGDS